MNKSQFKNLRSATNTIKDNSVVHWDVLFCDHLDDLLGDDSASQTADIVQFTSPNANAIAMSQLQYLFLMFEAALTYISRTAFEVASSSSGEWVMLNLSKRVVTFLSNVEASPSTSESSTPGGVRLVFPSLEMKSSYARTPR